MSEGGASEQQAITRRAGLVALGTLASRLLGAVRDAVIAASFTVSATDAFFVAWTIPNTLRQLLGEGAVSAAFIPMFSEIDERDGRAAAKRFYARFGGTMLALLFAVSVLGVAAAPWWATAYAAGYKQSPDKFALTVQLTALVFPYIALAGWAALQAGVLNALGRFFVASISPSLLNVALILAPWLFVPLAHALGLPVIAALALAALAGGVLNVLAQIPSVRAAGMLALPSFAPRDPAVRAGLLRMAPLLVGTGVYQLNILLSRLLASLLPAGSQSYLYYGQRLVEIPQGMLALAVASAALPSLARLLQRNEHEQAKAALRHSLGLSLFFALPASVALAALALPTVTMLFGRGHFDAVAAAQTARALVWMAAGVWAVATVQAVTRMFYAYGDTRTPVVCSAANLVSFVVTSLLAMGTLAHAAIALANSAASVVQLLLLLALLRRRAGRLGLRRLIAGTARNLGAALAMGTACMAVGRLGHWERGGNDPRNVLVYGAALMTGACVYLIASFLLRSPELLSLIAQLRSKGASA
jgi:putative peptidoglycan lipid II flippase